MSYQVALSRGRGVKREENRKFVMEEARANNGSLTGRIREAVLLKIELIYPCEHLLFPDFTKNQYYFSM